MPVNMIKGIEAVVTAKTGKATNNLLKTLNVCEKRPSVS